MLFRPQSKSQLGAEINFRQLQTLYWNFLKATLISKINMTTNLSSWIHIQSSLKLLLEARNCLFNFWDVSVHEKMPRIKVRFINLISHEPAAGSNLELRYKIDTNHLYIHIYIRTTISVQFWCRAMPHYECRIRIDVAYRLMDMILMGNELSQTLNAAYESATERETDRERERKWELAKVSSGRGRGGPAKR